MKMLKVCAGVCVVGMALSFADAARAQGWGDIKGQIVFAGEIPAKKDLKPNKDQAHCLSKGSLWDDTVLIDEKTRGLANVMIWLAPVSGTTMPIHPDLKAVPKEKVVIDQPCCLFIPRITMMREGQVLEIKNSAPVLHNAKIMGSVTGNGTINVTISPGQSITKQPRAEKRPMYLGCDIHQWMGGRIGVFNHPYFAVSQEDGTFEIKKAPTGKYKIFIQHEKFGWVHQGKATTGQEIEIKPGAVLDLGKLQAKDEQ